MAKLPEGHIKLAQVLLVEATFRHRPDFLTLPPGQKFEIGDVGVAIGMLVPDEGEGAFLTVTVETDPARNALYEFRVTMGAVVTPPPGKTVRQSPELAGTAAVVLYPFLREVIANLTSRGRFGPVWIHPIDARSAVKAVTERMVERTADERAQPPLGTPHRQAPKKKKKSPRKRS